ncbi:MAG TPA: carboxypeptidase-like regulatory domain-containing protein [Bryobacteraceae bacterium]|nr:carboxypeptidase-like regulatory domain-containing protein [Bryobacteraceae bacterium]
MKAVLTFLLFAAFAAQAQQRAQLTGVIRDSSGLGVPDTDVVMLNVETGIRRSTRTGEYGSYAVSSLAPGEYKVTVRKSGFRTIARTGIRLGATERARLDFLLEIGGMHEVVTVEGSASPIDTNDATSGFCQASRSGVSSDLAYCLGSKR